MRKQRVDALLIFRVQEIVFDFAILLAHRVIALDFDRAERLAVWDTVSNREIVAGVQNHQPYRREQEGAFHTAIGSDRGRFPVA